MELATIKRKWLKVAIKIGVPYDAVYQLEEEEYPLAAVFDSCLQGKLEAFYPLSWKSVAVVSEDIGEVSLAKNLNRKYCQKKQKEDTGNNLEYKGDYIGCMLYIECFIHLSNRFRYYIQAAGHSKA